jgi:hypothetical protein
VYQPVVWGSCDGRTAGMFDEAVMAEPWGAVGIAVTAGTHKAQEGASGWVRCSHWRLNLNSLVVISYHTPRKCVRVLIGTTSIQLFKDNHDSWGTCTNSA